VSHDALRRLGVFFPGDKVIYVPDDPFSYEEHAVVIKVASDNGPREANGHVQVRFDGRAAEPGAPTALVRDAGTVLWVWGKQLRHRQDLMREQALRRLRDPGVHLQTVVQAWALGAGIVRRDGDPLCGASGGKMVRAEARVTCPGCREKMKTTPRAGERR
jgi:hypothetical protein